MAPATCTSNMDRNWQQGVKYCTCTTLGFWCNLHFIFNNFLHHTIKVYRRKFECKDNYVATLFSTDHSK